MNWIVPAVINSYVTVLALVFQSSVITWFSHCPARHDKHAVVPSTFLCPSVSASSRSHILKPLNRRSTAASLIVASMKMTEGSQNAARNSNNNNNKDVDTITMLGFGSLLSERSSRMTFPDLTNFRLARVPNYRRVFGHATSIFFQRQIAHLPTKQMSSLSAEYCDAFPGFIASVFEVPNHNGAMMQTTGVPSQAFLEREEEFHILPVPYFELSPDGTSSPTASIDSSSNGEEPKLGILCTRSTDEAYLQQWGRERFDDHFTKYGIDTIWNWSPDSGLRPCPIYLRHCYLAAKGMGDICFNSFLDETFLVDRKTTIRQYVQEHPEVLETEPPPDLAERYCG